jgi:hypothetical protein
MIPSSKDLILQKKVKLYNNLANIDNCQGRLLAELEIYPNPRIVWEFEVLGDTTNFPYLAHTNNVKSLTLSGHAFLIEQELGVSNNFETAIGPRNALRGSTKKAIYGDLQNFAKFFVFYLSNTVYQSRRSDQKSEDNRYSIDVPIDKLWNIHLCIDPDSIEWLNPKNRNTGTLITAVGTLDSSSSNSDISQNLSENREITLENAVKRIQDICLLLSYINGGYVGLLYVEGYQRDARNTPIFSSALALSSQTTPLEKIGLSWFTNNSSLKNFLECIPVFEKIIENDSWRETFDFVLIQYFQAIQAGLVGWPVIASAVGAALERLSYMILVLEEPDLAKKNINELLFTQNEGEKQKQYNGEFKNKDEYKKQDGKYLSRTGIRLLCLLNSIGLTEDNNPDIVQSFLDTRNDAVHPKVSNITLDKRKKTIVKAIQWIDEVILWRIGYSGQYRDRTQAMESSIKPRYNLTLRDSNW